MEDGKIHLKAQEFNRWMEAMGEEITRAKDKLALLSEDVVRQIICTYILHIKCACISDGMDKHSKFLHLFAQLF